MPASANAMTPASGASGIASISPQTQLEAGNEGNTPTGPSMASVGSQVCKGGSGSDAKADQQQEEHDNCVPAAMV
jgi:hypothetical protein